MHMTFETLCAHMLEVVPVELDSNCLSAVYVFPLFVGPTCKNTFRFLLRAFGYHV